MSPTDRSVVVGMMAALDGRGGAARVAATGLQRAAVDLVGDLDDERAAAWIEDLARAGQEGRELTTVVRSAGTHEDVTRHLRTSVTLGQEPRPPASSTRTPTDRDARTPPCDRLAPDA